MYRSRPTETIDAAKNLLYAETDPSGRYGRFRDILGKGAMKTVYRAFDEVLGMEVAWNQVKLNNVFKSPDEMHRLYSEVHLLKNLDHHSIIRFHTSWIDIDRRTFNFITEMFTSGTLREYRQNYKRVNIGAVKNWARQILEGLAYLHGHDPPVIHRDLKCDNIFVNGHLGQVKIGDLGLAAIVRGASHRAHSVIGTPEFMAPELYEEEYDELVDIYSFGMCVLEMLTSEYPYSECSNPAQIYKKVTSGKLPEAFYRVHDVEAQRLIGKCLEPASKRPSARELLMDPFFVLDKQEELFEREEEDDKKVSKVPFDAKLKEVYPTCSDPQIRTTDMTITGSMKPDDEDTIFLKLRISSKHGQARNIYFPFEISRDTALEVAREMVRELEITDWNPIEIADMIDEEISGLVPSWITKNNCRDYSSDDHQFNINQYSFDYDDDEDDDDVDDHSSHPPLYHSHSSQSSSHASLPGLQMISSCDTIPFHSRNDVMISGYDHWPAGNWNNYDDASSQSSMNSYKLSKLTFLDREQEAMEQEEEEGTKTGDLIRSNGINITSCCTNTTTRNISIKKCNKNKNHHRDDDQVKMMMKNRVRSMVDLRSQLLHKSLVEEIHKRRMFNTVGSVENIGYYDPAAASCCHDLSGNPLVKKGGGGGGKRSVKNTLSSRRGFEW